MEAIYLLWVGKETTQGGQPQQKYIAGYTKDLQQAITWCAISRPGCERWQEIVYEVVI